jgi:thiamine pyrophosphate-dependent acetolactate synthase large subunit-like protein
MNRRGLGAQQNFGVGHMSEIHHNGGAAVVETLAAHGVDMVFGIPGAHNLEIYRHLRRLRMRVVTTRHEQGAGYAADGYARVTGRPGVVVTIGGPGLTNVMTAAATAYAESLPMLIISPGVPRGHEGRGSGLVHETKDSRGAMDRLIRWSRRVDSAEEASAAIAEAFASFEAGRPRPVHVEIPLDVLGEAWCGSPSLAVLRRPAAPLLQAVRMAADLLSAAERPLIVAGGGAVGAAGLLIRLAERIAAPVATTVNGKGVLPERHPLSLGASVRLQALQAEARRADLLFIVGSELGDSDLWRGSIDTSGTVIRCDVDPEQLDKNCPADVHLLSDASDCLTGLLDRLPVKARQGEEAAARAATVRAACLVQARSDAGNLEEVNQAMRCALSENAVLVGDSSQVTYYGSVHFFLVEGPRRLLYMPGYCTLGYGLPAAIGAKLADPAREVAVLVGDGAFMFSMQELSTAVELRLALPVVVILNGGYGEIRDQMISRGIPPTGVDLHMPDLPALARAMGARGFHAASADDLPYLVQNALDADCPTLITLDVR